ncbi:MAG: putative D-alanyl-D-alanine carboxypeptidase [Prokaryotic dsDNA virus sp.]|nr:MAG: putative D-alanyl-D-alanine carboxypeptidase [Prokaryotic dsDNA virus sp.]|tara:strand:+ start:8532 stop:9212 length:681 start_codon:yes stop_codon:yes gene_type:complete
MSGFKWIEAALSDGRLMLEDLANLVPFAQRELGVSDDGKPGSATLSALSEALDPPSVKLPRSRSEVERYYGNPSWTKTGKGRFVDLDDAWVHKNIRSFRLHTGKRVRMHRLVGDMMVELFEKACDQSGYCPASVQTYVPRVIGGTSRLSYHAIGIAFDVNPRANPWSGRLPNGELSELRKNMEECEKAGKISFVKTMEDAGVTWGGRWSYKGKKGWGDDMHFQFAG